MSSKTCSPIHLFQFAEAYNNLKNISRRHIHVHEPLIYDAVWVAAKTMNKLSKYLITSSGRFVQHLMQDVLERYYYTGLTVSYPLWCVHAHTHAHMHIHFS